MAYTPLQDGTQVFGIPDSPVTIGGQAYIAEDIQIQMPQQRVPIKDGNGVPIGQTFIPDVMTGSCKLQRASSSTPVPTRQAIFTLQGQSWIVENVGQAFTQGAYAYVNITFAQKLN